MDPHRLHELQTQQILDAKFKMGELSKLTIPEKLEGISEISSFGERVEALRMNSERSFNTILHYTYGNFKWKFTPEEIEEIEYKEPSDDIDVSVQGMNLVQEAKRIYIFLEESAADKKRLKNILIEMLENLHPDEGKILKGIFAGKVPYKNITKKLVATAFPDLFPGYIEEEAKTPKGKPGRPKKQSAPGSTTVSAESKENEDVSGI